MKKLSILFSLFISSLAIAQNCAVEEHHGEATYYDFEEFGGFGNCSFDDTKIRPFLIGALNELDYNQADYCGTCVEITGPSGKVTVQIIDRCPECKTGDIDLSPEAFDYIAPRIDGRVDISWHLVACPVQNNIRFVFKEGSTQWWSAIQVLNHRNKIEKLEVKQNGVYVSLPRQKYNYFLSEKGLGVGPYDIRITDVFDNTITETGIPLTLAKEIVGTQQFPECIPLALDKIDPTKEISYSNQILSFGGLIGIYKVTDLTGKIISSNSISDEVAIDLQKGHYIISVFSNNNAPVTKKIWVD